ncbi:MAG: S41 family peptidase [Acidobacteriota bacterium]
MSRGKRKTDWRQIIGRRAIVRGLLFALAVAWPVFSPSLSPVAPESFQSSAESDAAAVSTSTHEGRMAVFDDVWSTISVRYYDHSFNALANGLTWETQRSTFRALAAETNSGQELYVVLRRMVASLKDPHTRVFSPAEKFDWWRPRSVTIGLMVREVGGFPTVFNVERGSEPQRAGIVPGDVIEAVDDQPALLLVQRTLSDSVGQGASARFRAFARFIDGPPESIVEIRWKGKDGKKKSAQFTRYWQQRELGLRVRRERGDFAIVELDAFTSQISQRFAVALKEKLTDVRGIILDLRGNGGGDAEAMTDVASAFLRAGLSLGRFIDRSGTSFSIATRRKSPLIPDRLTQTNLPLVILTSERTSSAAEIFIAGLRASRRATIIGAQTCGCVLAIRARHELPDGGLLDVSELDYQTAAGERLEKKGIKPDETVVVQRNDLYAGHDRAMELAINRLKTLRTAQR